MLTYLVILHISSSGTSANDDDWMTQEMVRVVVSKCN